METEKKKPKRNKQMSQQLRQLFRAGNPQYGAIRIDIKPNGEYEVVEIRPKP